MKEDNYYRVKKEGDLVRGKSDVSLRSKKDNFPGPLPSGPAPVASNQVKKYYPPDYPDKPPTGKAPSVSYDPVDEKIFQLYRLSVEEDDRWLSAGDFHPHKLTEFFTPDYQRLGIDNLPYPVSGESIRDRKNQYRKGAERVEPGPYTSLFADKNAQENWPLSPEYSPLSYGLDKATAGEPEGLKLTLLAKCIGILKERGFGWFLVKGESIPGGKDLKTRLSQLEEEIKDRYKKIYLAGGYTQVIQLLTSGNRRLNWEEKRLLEAMVSGLKKEPIRSWERIKYHLFTKSYL